MERLTIENRKLKQIIELKNVEINGLKSELAKFKVLSYRKLNVSQSRTSTFEYKKKIKIIFDLINMELNKINYSIDTIIIRSKTNEEEGSPFIIKYNTTDVAKSDVDKCLFFKDKISLADHKYHSFRRGMDLKKKMVPLRLIKKRKLEISTGLNATELSSGYYIEPIKYIKLRISYYLKNLISGNDTNNNKVLVKLSCDGTILSRNVKIVNFVFSIINEKIKASTASGCYRIAAFRIENENYEIISEWLPTLWEKIKALKRIFYNPLNNEISEEDSADAREYEIEHCFAADYKMMLIVLGLQGAHSNHPCIMCEQDKDHLDTAGKLNTVKIHTLSYI